jgi:hypothetical protein
MNFLSRYIRYLKDIQACGWGWVPATWQDPEVGIGACDSRAEIR